MWSLSKSGCYIFLYWCKTRFRYILKVSTACKLLRASFLCLNSPLLLLTSHPGWCGGGQHGGGRSPPSPLRVSQRSSSAGAGGGIRRCGRELPSHRIQQPEGHSEGSEGLRGGSEETHSGDHRRPGGSQRRDACFFYSKCWSSRNKKLIN